VSGMRLAGAIEAGPGRTQPSWQKKRRSHGGVAAPHHSTVQRAGLSTSTSTRPVQRGVEVERADCRPVPTTRLNGFAKRSTGLETKLAANDGMYEEGS